VNSTLTVDRVPPACNFPIRKFRISSYGQGDEIAGLVSYLAGPEAGFITGASLTIDGGFSA